RRILRLTLPGSPAQHSLQTQRHATPTAGGPLQFAPCSENPSAITAKPSATMKASKFHLVTTRETPADAEIASHQLMLRAGMIRKLTGGIYTWTPLGFRVLKKVENIVREE